MQRPITKYISTLLFLAAFLVPRITDLHAIDHLFEDDDAISCDLCDITYHTLQFDLFVGAITYKVIEPLNSPSSYVVNSSYNSPIAKIVSPTTVYNKPPPVL